MEHLEPGFAFASNETSQAGKRRFSKESAALSQVQSAVVVFGFQAAAVCTKSPVMVVSA